MDKIVEMLEAHQVTLMKDVAMLDQMFELNQQYCKELTMYIIAGKKRLASIRANELEELRKKAEASGTQRMPRPITTWSICATGLRRSCTIWS